MTIRLYFTGSSQYKVLGSTENMHRDSGERYRRTPQVHAKQSDAPHTIASVIHKDCDFSNSLFYLKRSRCFVSATAA